MVPVNLSALAVLCRSGRLGRCGVDTERSLGTPLVARDNDQGVLGSTLDSQLDRDMCPRLQD